MIVLDTKATKSQVTKKKSFLVKEKKKWGENQK